MKMLAQFLALNTCSVNLGGREKRRKEGREEGREGGREGGREEGREGGRKVTLGVSSHGFTTV